MNQLTHSDISNGSSKLIHCPTISPSNGWVCPKYFHNSDKSHVCHKFPCIYKYIHTYTCVYIYVCMYVCMYEFIYLSIYLSIMYVCMYVCVCVCGCGVNPCFQGIYELFSFSVLRQGVRAAHPVLHQRRDWMSAGDIWPDQSDVPAMWPFRFLNSVIHSQRRPYSICHCLKTCLGTMAFSRAKKYKSIWASWTDILSYKCMYVRMYVCMYTYFQLLPYTFHKSLIAIHGLIQLSSAPRFLGTQVPCRHDAVVAVAMHQS